MMLQKKLCEGSCLVELLLVLAIMGALLSIGIPYFWGFVNNTEAKVCGNNRSEIEGMYQAETIGESNDDADDWLRRQIEEYRICPANGEITIDDGKIHCELHYPKNNEDRSCEDICADIGAQYRAYLSAESLNHNNILFSQFIQGYGTPICPSQGVVSYSGGQVVCSLHSEGAGDSNDSGGDIPFL